MFDPGFYRIVLPDRVSVECHRSPGMVPVVEFRFADGAVLDVCHIVHLDQSWLAIAHFRDAEKCDDMDLTFTGYESISRIHLIMHPPEKRRLGFDIARTQRTEEGTT